MAQTIQGYLVKELICKNDDCRLFFGWENVAAGVLIIPCPRCKQKSLFKIRYSKMKENIDMLIHDMKEGGE